MKDTFYKEEVKKYSEKLVESELQKQKLMSELESLRTSVDEKTRKIDAMTRDRDRLLQD
jgi:septal ring factor EnvC (AmiA/AmiB activator)